MNNKIIVIIIRANIITLHLIDFLDDLTVSLSSSLNLFGHICNLYFLCFYCTGASRTDGRSGTLKLRKSLSHLLRYSLGIIRLVLELESRNSSPYYCIGHNLRGIRTDFVAELLSIIVIPA